MKIVFMGTPGFAVNALRALMTHHQVVCVYTQPPRPAGRGGAPRPSPVQIEAEAHHIPVRCPETLKTPEVQDAFKALAADVAVVCAYGLILPQAVLDAPKMGCVNIHASLLPRWRGAAPIQRAIQAGDTTGGVTIMRMDAGLDTGDILMSESVPIPPGMTAGQLHDALSELGARLILKALDERPQPVQQPGGATYAEKIDKAEAVIDWRLPAGQIERNIRAFNPCPGAYFLWNGERIKVFQARVHERVLEKPGTIVDHLPRIACGGGTSLQLLTLQREGKKALSAGALLQGFSMPVGTIL
ncbi:MAG: methionyl-tRNA formyltransferase [Alphaproteobacteria bacterium]|nr:methionyl-tRNA formyltransferase [Alphaproteobacteria bacterium]